MPDFTYHKLGKQPARIDPRTLKLSNYLKKSALPAPPLVSDWSGGIHNWGMCLNGPNTFGPPVPADGLGDCTIAAVTHAVTGLRKAATGAVSILPDYVTLRYYSVFDGYTYGDEATDNGGIVIQVLNDWRSRGFGFRPHKSGKHGKRKMGSDQLLAYAAPSLTDHTEVMQGINLFGGMYIGLMLPLTAQTQNIWSVVGDGQTGPSAPGSWGGHAVWVVGYTQRFVWVVTWGQLMAMTWGFWDDYVDEAFALLSPDFINAKGLDPAGFDIATLMSDLEQVTA
jgi:hypothetical protein